MNGEDSRKEEAVANGDELQLLEGVGPKYAQALRDIGVRTFADLAAYESETDLQLALEEKAGVRIELWKIENTRGTRGSWIEQARERAETADVPINSGNSEEDYEELEPSTDWRMVQEFTLFLDDRVDKEGQRQWQLRAYDGASGEEATFPVQDYDYWVNWILAHADIPNAEKFELPEQPIIEQPEPTPVEPVAEAEIAAPEDVRLDIANLDIARAETSEYNELEAGVTFRIASADAGRLVAEGIPYQVEVHTVRLADGASRLAGYTRGHLMPGRLEYRALVAFPMLEQGQHELQAIVMLFPPNETVSFYKGLTFKIVP